MPRVVRLALTVLTLAFLHGCVSTPQQQPPPVTTPPKVLYEPVAWDKVDGWRADPVQEAWAAFQRSCRGLATKPAWTTVCAASQSASDARQFFEANFVPYRIVQSAGLDQVIDTGLITGYYEPLLRGSRKPTAAFPVPLFAPPDDLLTIDLGELFPELKGKRVRGRVQGRKVVPYYTRAEIAGKPSLQGKELVWVDNAVDAFFLEVQGSGRVQFADGSVVRMAYADQNGQPYRSIGRYLVDQKEMTLDQASAQSIRRWVEEHPERKLEVLNANPSVVFFREEKIENPSEGPKGALGVPLTAGRSLAVDPQFVPLGAPVFLATTQPNSTEPLKRLVMAQDTGGAIRGINRGDLFWGFGPAAGESAGRMKQQGRMWLLWPKGLPLPSP